MLNSQVRIKSIKTAKTIGVSIDNIRNFELNSLEGVGRGVDLVIPNVRLGKQVERVFSLLINSSESHKVVKENIQIIDGKITVGELDFIIKNVKTGVLSHLEIVYKFYLYDPKYSNIELEKWIGPNRKDSFIEKFQKLRLKQFPLLFKPITSEILSDVDIFEMKQELCFMASLFVPFSLTNSHLPHVNNEAIVGYWLALDEFNAIIDSSWKYCLPQKSEWGIEPRNNEEWFDYYRIKDEVLASLKRNFSPLVWIKKDEVIHEQCFIVWW